MAESGQATGHQSAAPQSAAAQSAAAQATGYQAMREGVGALVSERDVVSVSGPEASVFLQGQLSQDVLAMAERSSRWGWVLQPAGKVVALVRVYRDRPERYLLDTDAGFGESLLARLNRFKLRTKVEMAKLEWCRVAVRGPRFAEVSAPPGAICVDASWPGLPGVDFLGEGLVLPAGVEEIDPSVFEAARIEAGVPVMGKELNEGTIPAETGLIERTVSFTKGCYTGQELVARIDSRGGNVPRRLRGFLLSGPIQAPSALAVQAGDKTAAVVTSVARSPRLGWVALGYASRGTEVGATLVLAAAGDPAGAEAGRGDPLGEVRGGQVTAKVQALPLVP